MTNVLERKLTHKPTVSQNDFLYTLNKYKTKQLTVGIVGLGYVGLPLSHAFAAKGIPVIGFDVDVKKIEAIQKGNCYIKHLDNGTLKTLVERKMLSASNNFSHISTCDAVIICVPTPLNSYLEPDLSFIETTCRSIGRYLSPHTLVSLESTTWPGTTEEIVKPILEKESKLKLGENLYLCFSPEREDPGNKTFNTHSIAKIVGGANQQSLQLATILYKHAINQVVPVSTTRTAETTKLLENIFRSVNIALVNELKIICDEMDIDIWEVINAASTKPFGFMPFYPGPGLGGHCIPIDPFYLSYKAKEKGIYTRFIELAGEINRSMPKYVVNKVQDCLNEYGKPLKNAKILILGMAYKADIDDMRESPSLELFCLLEKKGAIVDYHDPYFPEIGPTRKYPNLAGKKSVEINTTYDCFLLATDHSCFDKNFIIETKVPIVDTRNYFPKLDHIYRA